MNKPHREKMVRVNTRIRPDQDAYIKAKSKQDKCFEGDVTRAMLDDYIKRNPLAKSKKK